MRIQVDTSSLLGGTETPHRLRFDGRNVEVTEVLDQWAGADYRYFKVKGADGNIYIVRLDEPDAVWELTMFQMPSAEITKPPGSR